MAPEEGFPKAAKVLLDAGLIGGPGTGWSIRKKKRERESERQRDRNGHHLFEIVARVLLDAGGDRWSRGASSP